MMAKVEISTAMARMVLTSCRSMAVISRKPSPRCEAKSSPSMVPSSVSEKPMRRPEKISGNVAGTRMRHAVCAGVSRMARPARRYVRVDVAHGVHGEQHHRDDAVQRPERDLGRHAETEQQKDHRIERDLGDRVEADQNRLGDLAGEAVAAQDDADQHAADAGDSQRLQESEPGLAQMRQEAGLADHLPEMRQRRRRCGDRGVARDLVQDLPQGDECDRHQDRVTQRAQRHCHAIPRRRASRRSQVQTSMLKVVTMPRTNRISAYMRGLSKLS